jgi:hypothetical protein
MLAGASSHRAAVGCAGGFLVAVLLSSATPAAAHDAFEITAEARFSPAALELRITMAAATAARACAGAAAPEALAACARRLFEITAGGQPWPARSADARRTVENDVELTVRYDRPAPGPVSFEAVFLDRLPDPTYGAVLTVEGDGVFLGQKLLGVEGGRALTVALGGRAVTPTAGEVFRSYLALGVRHILAGHDHLLFLAGLLIMCRRLRDALVLVTCFTAAHSVTLALGAADVWSPPGRLVEPLIAASIVFVGVENLLRARATSLQRSRARWTLAFAFGLLHGMSFAGALREAGLASSGAVLVLSLLAFNLGVELGQVVAAGWFLLAIALLRRTRAFSRWGTQALSALVVAAGLWWLVMRATGRGGA